MRLVLLLLAASLADGYRVLVVTSVPSPSHNILGRGIVNALLKAGHSVSWATPYPENVKPVNNLTVIDVSATQAVFANMNMSDNVGFNGISKMVPISASMVTLTAGAPQMAQALVSEQFDAVVTEWFISDLAAGFAAVQQAPWIMLSGVTFHPLLEELMDDISSTTLHPVMLNSARVPMNFWERVLNSILVDSMKFASWVVRLLSERKFANVFGPLAAARGSVLPPLSAVYNNVSVLLVNSNPALAPAQSLPPNVVEIGGYFIDESGALPKDLQQLLDASTQGFIYFSLGSVVKISTLPDSLKVELIQMFADLPYTVLWKCDQELTGLPKNVFVRDWFPQSAILAHPNIILFITHGGLLSTTEAVHYGVPLLAVPVFGDQPMNADRAVEAGYAAKVPFHVGMAREVRAGLQEMTTNDSYSKKVKHLSKLYHSRPVEPSKLIAHYVELAIETKGAFHLRSSTHNYSWFQRRRLDQLLGCMVFFYSLYVACRIVVRELRRLYKRKKD